MASTIPINCTKSDSKMMINVQSSIDKSVYVPGENIEFNFSIANFSGVERNMYVQLIERLYSVSNKRSIEEYILSKSSTIIKLQAWTALASKKVVVAVPPCPPSGLHCCDQIKISYAVELVVEPGLTLKQDMIGLNILDIKKAPNTRSVASATSDLHEEQIASAPPSYEESIVQDGSLAGSQINASLVQIGKD